MPSLGSDMEAGTLVEWLVKPGDAVRRGDIIAVVETQKGAIEIEVFQDGVVEEFLVPEGTRVPVGTPLALIDGDAGRAGDRAPAPNKTPSPAAQPKPQPVVQPQPAGAFRASPAARNLAGSLGVDLTGLKGTGPDGAIVASDVERAAGTAKAPPRTRSRGVEMQGAIAAAMERSKREIPHYYLSGAVPLEPALDWMERRNATRAAPDRLLAGVLFIKAVALALRDFPEFNGVWEQGEFRPSAAIHTGVAISLRDGGLVAPALHDADRKGLDALMAEFRDLVTRARTGKLRSSELSDSTVTITSMGEAGIDAVFPIIYPPQVAIIGFGSIVTRPWETNGGVGLTRLTTLSVAGDHRVSNGHRGARFLNAVRERLQHPEAL